MRPLWIALTLGNHAARADVGIPIVSVAFPFLVVNLAFVVAIEVFVLGKIRPALRGRRLVAQVFLANLVTTLIGYPLVAFAEAFSALFGWSLGWLLPFPDLERMHLYVGVGTALTFVPCFFLSVWVEGAMLRRWLAREIRWRDVAWANLASYAFLLAQVFANFPVPFLRYGKYTVEPTFDLLQYLFWPFLRPR